MAIENGISNKRVISKNGIREQYVGEQWNNDYILDNFGPVIVPNECYFVLGDNRHYSANSRYIGFVHKSKYVGTVIDTW
jgi:signal peptidase I